MTIDYYLVPPQPYGLFFAANIAGMMGANFLSARRVMRQGAERIFRFGTAVAALAGAALALYAWRDWGLAGLATGLFVYISAIGLIVANSVAGSLAAVPKGAGAASALLGASHYGAGMLGASAVGWLADGAPRGMALIVAACGLGCFLSAAFLARRT